MTDRNDADCPAAASDAALLVQWSKDVSPPDSHQADFLLESSGAAFAAPAALTSQDRDRDCLRSVHEPRGEVCTALVQQPTGGSGTVTQLSRSALAQTLCSDLSGNVKKSANRSYQKR